MKAITKKHIFSATLMALAANAVTAHANGSNELVGAWQCSSSTQPNEAGEYQQNKHHLVYQKDGTAKEDITIDYYMNDTLYATSKIKANYNWELLGGRQKTSNIAVDSYEIYNHITQSQVKEEEVAPFVQSFLNANGDNPWQSITFIDRNTHAYNFETGENGICNRISQ